MSDTAWRFHHGGYPPWYAATTPRQHARHASPVPSAFPFSPRGRRSCLRLPVRARNLPPVLLRLLLLGAAVSLLRAAAIAPSPTQVMPSAVRRFYAARNYTWVKTLPCATKLRPDVHQFAQSHRKDWRNPPHASTPCFTGGRQCFRAVLDGVVNMTETHNGKPLAQLLDPQILQIVRKRFGRPEAEINLSRYKAYVPEAFQPASPGAKPFGGDNYTNPWQLMHADYFENINYEVTAILYLGDEEQDTVSLVGGETALVDALVQDADADVVRLVEGMIVEPRRGRLLLFSGGGENYHTPLPVRRGRRTAWHLWMKCKAPEPPLEEL